MKALPSRLPAARRSFAANALLGCLLFFTLAVPAGSCWLRDREQRRLEALLNEGRHTTAEVTFRLSSGRGSRGGTAFYRYSARGSEYHSATSVAASGGNFCRGPVALPVIYDPADPGNHVVASSLSRQDVDDRLAGYSAFGFAGLLAALLAVCSEVAVWRQQSLAASGRVTTGTVTAQSPVGDGRRSLLTYEYTPAAGGRCTGSTKAPSIVGSRLGHGWPALVYDPARPNRHMLLEEMWAVDWQRDAGRFA